MRGCVTCIKHLKDTGILTVFEREVARYNLNFIYYIYYCCNQKLRKSSANFFILHQILTLDLHEASVHEVFRYPCGGCDYSAKQLSHLKMHKENDYKGIIHSCKKDFQICIIF